MELGFFLGLLLQELLKLILFLIDLESVHLIFALLRVELVSVATRLIRSETGRSELGLLQVVIKCLVLPILQRCVVRNEAEFLDEELLDLYVRDW